MEVILHKNIQKRLYRLSAIRILIQIGYPELNKNSLVLRFRWGFSSFRKDYSSTAIQKEWLRTYSKFFLLDLYQPTSQLITTRKTFASTWYKNPKISFHRGWKSKFVCMCTWIKVLERSKTDEKDVFTVLWKHFSMEMNRLHRWKRWKNGDMVQYWRRVQVRMMGELNSKVEEFVWKGLLKDGWDIV